LSLPDAKPKSESAEKLEHLIRSRMPERTLLDILSNAQHYIGWADEFGPISGTASKLDNPIEKYLSPGQKSYCPILQGFNA
jgi:hypothetical protein